MKKNNAKRVLALVLASAMLMQQSWMGALAAETETVTEAQTEKLTEAPATEAPAPETKAEETQAPATETAAPETKPEETQAPAAEAPAEGEEAGETQATEAPGETTTEAPTEAPTEAVTEAATEAVMEKESETEEEAVLDTVIKQEVFQKTVEDDVQPMIKYTVKVTNKAKTADAEGVSVKVLLAKDLSYTKEEGETAELGVYGKLDDAVNADVFKDIELDDAAKTAYAEGSAALWQDQKIAAGEEKEFVFFAAVEDGVTDTEALRNLWFVNDEAVANDKLQWQNAELLKVEKELPTEFTCEYGNMVVTATLSDGAILPEGAQFVVTEKTLSEEEAALIEESLGDEQTMTGYVAYDMHFEVDGKEVEPENGTVSVSVSYEKAKALAPVNEGEEAVPEDGEVKMLHITDEQTVEDVTTDVDVKKNGKVREVGFTTDGFSTFVLMSTDTIAITLSDIYVHNIKVGSRSFAKETIADASRIFNGGVSGNNTNQRYIVYVGEMLELSATAAKEYTFEASSECVKQLDKEYDESHNELFSTFIGNTPGRCEIVLKDNAGGDTKTFYIDVHYPIYVKAGHGTYHKDTVHEYLGFVHDGTVPSEEFLYSPDKGEKMYVKNSNVKNGAEYKDGKWQPPFTNKARYVVAPNDTIELQGIRPSGSEIKFSSDGKYAELEQTVTSLGNRFELVTAIVTPTDAAKTYSFDTTTSESDSNLLIKFGEETFYYEVEGTGNANHFDIEIADGGTYTAELEEIHPDGSRTVTTIVYDAFVSGVNKCVIEGNNHDDVNVFPFTIPSNEYWEHGALGTSQYELTSAYEQRDDGSFIEGVTKKRPIPRADITNVTFDLELYLRPKTRTVTTYKDAADTTGVTENKPFSDDEKRKESFEISGAKISMDSRKILDAYNKCPDHTGLDFTINLNVNEAIDYSIVKVRPEVKKILQNGELQDAQFSFELRDEKGNVRVVENKADGSVVFPEITYNVDGKKQQTYYYYIKERIPSETGEITYDKRTVRMTVVVISDEKKATATVTYQYKDDDSDEWKNFTGSQAEFINIHDGKPKKEETEPDAGKLVQIEQEITYKIHWKNYQNDKATVTIIDPLDPGLTFSEADNGGTYDEDTHTVTWKLGEKDPGTKGDVTLTVIVNEKAFDNWKYGEYDTPVTGSGKDYQVLNRAGVKVGNDPKVYTDIIPNPVPEKEETDPGADKTVAVGKVITYKIHWKNGHEEPADVTITDKLDPGVDFESADHEGKYDETTHTVTWVLKTQAAGAEGDVELKVKVNKDAKLTWDYENGAGADEDGKILNQAGVKVGNDDEVKTQVIPNPVDEGPHKTEETPGDRKMVGIGDEIVYKITWKNYQDAEADVVITDKLDPGVEFAGASGEGDDAGKYDAAAHTVTWTLKKRAADASGEVTLTVTVTEKAYEGWKYVDEPTQEKDAFEAVTGKDYEVWNRAAVKVGNDPKVYTNIVENPVPEKTEPTPGDRLMVNVGEPITYEIGWKNGYEREAEVIVTDPLDPGVSYVSSEPTGTYDEKTHTVTWKIKAKSEEKGTIKLNVTVNENAFKDWKYGEADEPVIGKDEQVKDYEVWNRAKVQIDNDSQYTAIVENPVPEKTEPKPGDRVMVNVGDPITYEIGWKNGHKETAKVTITDPLDPGVTYVSSKPAGTYDEKTHTVTWSFDADGEAKGTIELNVTVNESAFKDWKYGEADESVIGKDEQVKDYEVWNRAKVQVGNDSAYTDIVENPVPEKTEPTPGDRVMVNVDDPITYEIGWKNGHKETAKVTVTDPLDPGVTYVSSEPAGTYDEKTHTVTWEFEAKGEEKGTIKLNVMINESAFKDWKYGETDEPVIGKDEQVKDYEVWNRAKVQVGNDSTYTDIVENPVPEKTEPTPGDRVMVNVGDPITYEIGWKNGHKETAKVNVTDPLDPGVTYVSSKPTGTYDEKTHTVTWSFDADGEEKGTIELNVTVNENAFKDWKYGEADAPVVNADEKAKDYEVWNRAKVQVGNDSTYTDIVENPVPEKEEVTPGKGVMTEVGKDITYEIHWKNGHKEPATVTVTDKLDPGVTFKSADNGGTCKDGVVTWTLEAAAAGEAGSEGVVKLTVTVNENAYDTWQYGSGDKPVAGEGKDYEVLNRATVQVGHDPAVMTDIIPNPVPEKEELTPGKGVMTEVGEDITYEIHWKNGHDEPTTVTVTDKLDPGVTFKSADNGGMCKDGVVTWTLNAAAAGETGSEGSVKLTVTVNENAYKTYTYGDGDTPAAGEGKDYEVLNRAGVKVGDDPKVLTNIIPNPVPEKTEVTPGDGVMVQVGDEITYKIHWKNGHDTVADVVITDVLDPGVTFKDADHDGSHDKSEKGGTVTWTLEAQAAGAEGDVSVTVTVNEDAYKTYTYGDSDTPVAGEGRDCEVLNRAGVQVDDDPKVLTNIIPNPVPEKTEVTPGDGVMVQVGDEITYKIHWKNGHDTVADVVITDVLDPGVTFKSADNGGKEKDGTVTWMLEAQAAGAEGDVSVTVTVNEDAYKTYTYGGGDKPAAGEGKDYEVLNRAAVQVGHDPKVLTNIIPNPVPEKTEVTPGKGMMVGIGQEITYEIHWKNGHEEPATVTITDRLDPGVTFKSADNGGTCKDGVVTWTLDAAAAGEAGSEGSVKLIVTVNENAYDTWQYGGGDKPAAGEGKDYEVLNRAAVQVGHDPKVLTNIIPNPVPEKTEVTPGKGMMVGIGQEITYEIHWKNGHEEPATVTITDRLDPGVTFKSADHGGTCENGVVTWTLEEQAAGAEGDVSVTVTVNENAYKTYTYGDGDEPTAGEGKDYEVLNRAGVKVGDDPKVLTNIIPNPVPDKEEIDPGANETVYVGDQITYEIYWKNGHDTAADVTVTDPLDEGLDFVSADQGGTYDSAARTVTWVIKNAAAGQSGKVTLVAKVNMNARKDDHIVENQAGVQVGNDPKVLTKIIPNPTPEEPRDGSISVTKKLTSLGEDIYAINETFYVALFSDEACRKRVTEIKAVEFKNASSSTVTFKELDIGRTYYVGEVNANGEVILTGQVKDGTLFVADFNKGKSAVIEKSGDSKTIVFENTFQTIPDSFYRSGRLNITKKLLGADGEALNSDETFYAGIFEDAGHTRLSDKVSENIVELNLAGGSSVSKTVSVVCDPKGPTTLYVTEVTSDGKPVGRSFGYAVTVDKEKVSLDMQNMTADVTITNQELEETESEVESESESESETVKPTEKSVKTGDNTPIVRYVLLILAALTLAVIAAEVRRRRRAEK